MKRLARHLISRLPLIRWLGPSRFIFCYHDISRAGQVGHSPLYSTDPDQFERQLDYLSSIFDWKSLDEITEAGASRTARPQAALTFDDGFASVLHTAAPILERRRIPFAAFVCRSAIEQNFLPISTAVLLGEKTGDRPFAYESFSHEEQERLIASRAELAKQGVLAAPLYMNIGQIRELEARGATIGSHSQNHRILSGCSPEELQDEIHGNQSYLTSILKTAPRHFAIPYGKPRHFNAETVALLEKCGIRFAYLTAQGPLRISAQALPQPQLLPRLSILNQSPSQLAYTINRSLLTPAREAT